MDAASFVDGGRAFVPVRYLAYALGVPEDGVEWDGGAQRVVCDVEKESTRGQQPLRG